MKSSRSSIARQVCLISCAALMLLYALKTLVLWPKAIDTRLIIFALQAMPLLLLLPGLLRRRWRSYVWLCFILLLYFMNAVLALFAPGRLFIDWLILAAIIGLFVAAMLFIRWRRVELADS